MAIHVQVGRKWGESVDLEVHGRRRVWGKYRWRISGKIHAWEEQRSERFKWRGSMMLSISGLGGWENY